MARFQKSQQGRHVAPHSARTIRRVPSSRYQIDIIQFAFPQGLLGAQRPPRQTLPGDHLLRLQAGKRAPAILQPRRAQIQAIKGPKQILERRHMTRRFTVCVNLSTQAAFSEHPGKLRCPLQHTARTRRRWRQRAKRTTHSALSLRRLVPMHSIRLSNQRRRTSMRLSYPIAQVNLSLAATVRCLLWAERRCVLRRRRLSPRLRNSNQFINTIHITPAECIDPRSNPRRPHADFWPRDRGNPTRLTHLTLTRFGVMQRQ